MALIMWLIMRWSCLLSYTDHVPLEAINKQLSSHESNSLQAIIMELSCEESCRSAGNNQAAEQAGITQHSWQLSSRWQAGIVQLSWQLSSRWADTNHTAQQARITWLSMHCSRGWSYTDHVIDHALITWLIMHWSFGYHALITWLIIHRSRYW